MKESHSEDQASHAGPESCEGAREGALEALTGEPAGRAIEPRNRFIIREADLLMVWGRQHRTHRRKGQGGGGSRAVEEPWHDRLLIDVAFVHIMNFIERVEPSECSSCSNYVMQ